MYIAHAFFISDVELFQNRQKGVYWFSASIHSCFISDLSIWVPAHQGKQPRSYILWILKEV